MTANHSIDEACRAGGTTARGIRFWQEQGLLGDVEQSACARRLVSPSSFPNSLGRCLTYDAAAMPAYRPRLDAQF
jgi:hypothetical protein